MTRKSQAQLFAELESRYGRVVAEAFFAAIDDLRTAAEVQRVIAALERGAIEDALDALHIDPAVFGVMLDRIGEAYREGGRTATDYLPRRAPDGTALVFRFDVRNPEAERRLRDQSSQLVTRITQDQREAVRQALQSSLEQGVNPRTAALRIVGTVNRATGRREGGILGLSAPQERYVASARDELASGDPALLRNYLDRTRRDRRFDRSINKAIREERPVDPAIAAKALLAYERRLLELRGQLIAQVETFTALSEARDEAYRQAIASGSITASQVTKVWRHFPSENPRVQHMAMQGESVRFDQPFTLPDGTQMRYPHDPRAPIRHTANCRCGADYVVDFLAGLR